MPVTISPTLLTKIERRAKRAFRRFDEGDANRLHRISGVSATSLKYRLRRSTSSSVDVVRRDDGTIVVDPPTTGLIELLTSSDVERLNHHAGEIQGFVRVPPKKKMLIVGELVTSQYYIEPRSRVAEKVVVGHRVFRVGARSTDVDKVDQDKVLLNGMEVLEELSLVKDFGFTDGQIDVATKSDIKKLQKHMGTVRAYMLVKAGTTFQVQGTFQVPSEPLMSREQCIDKFKIGDHVYAVEAEHDDLFIEDDGATDFTASEWKVVDELDLKSLGFTDGLLDCLTKADVVRLKEKKHRGRVRAYKFTDENGESPYQKPKIKYEPGKDYEVKDANTDPSEGSCHKGINVAAVDWCKNNMGAAKRRVFAFEFDVDDIAAVPISTDGKFRVHRCKCLEELDSKTFLPLPTHGEAEEKTKKRGFMDRLLGRGTDEDKS